MFILALCLFVIGGYSSSGDPRHGYLAANQSFIFEMNCNKIKWTTNQCDSARIALKEVGTMIGEQLLFRVPVKVCVDTFKSEKLTLLNTLKLENPYSIYINSCTEEV